MRATRRGKLYHAPLDHAPWTIYQTASGHALGRKRCAHLRATSLGNYTARLRITRRGNNTARLLYTRRGKHITYTPLGHVPGRTHHTHSGHAPGNLLHAFEPRAAEDFPHRCRSHTGKMYHILGPSWALWSAPEAVFGSRQSQASWKPLGDLLGLRGGVLGASWGLLEAS